MKIWYAANNTLDSKLQLIDILKELSFIPDLNIKVSAYKQFTPDGLKLDFCLNSLLDVFNKHQDYVETFDILPKSEELTSYMNLVKAFSPDLFISDCDAFSSYIANILPKPTEHWVVSSGLLWNALSQGCKVRVTEKFPILKKTIFEKNLRASIINADKRLVYSHVGDVLNGYTLYKEYDWVRPYIKSNPQPEELIDRVTAVFAKPTLKELVYIKDNFPNYKIYTECPMQTKYFITKSYYDEEYYEDISKSIVVVNNGESRFVADAFYNRRHSLILTNFFNLESVLNSALTEAFFIGNSQLIRKDLIYEDGQTKIDQKPHILSLTDHIKQLITKRKYNG